MHPFFSYGIEVWFPLLLISVFFRQRYDRAVKNGLSDKASYSVAVGFFVLAFIYFVISLRLKTNE